MKIQKMAGLMVRLFLCLSFFSGFLNGGEKIPEKWIDEAIEEAKRNFWKNNVPDYERELVARIRNHILEAEAGEFLDYETEIPETGVPFEMVAIKGGSFLMGSPEGEKNRELDEGPRREITVSDFWIGKFEVTWDQFGPFAIRTNADITNRNGTPKNPETKEELVHWVTAPTQPFLEMDFGMGMHNGFPAVSMSHHSANKFCQWLSLQTGHFYRLPTEAEWEYACRAGTTGSFHCPDEQIEDFAVIDPEQIRVGYEKVGTKKPNPWGLYDMHGNVMEWCLDAYSPGLGHYDRKDPYSPPKQRFGRVIRGGSWYDPPGFCRSASRFCSNDTFLSQDPQLPKSIWWLTDAQWLGFRIVRSNRIPSLEEMFQIWNCGAMHQQKGDRVFELQ
jgi:formylglycine-generating enzyme required for sulfatase activity